MRMSGTIQECSKTGMLKDRDAQRQGCSKILLGVQPRIVTALSLKIPFPFSLSPFPFFRLSPFAFFPCPCSLR